MAWPSKDRNGVRYGLYKTGLHINVDHEMLNRVAKFAHQIGTTRAEAARVLLEKGLEDVNTD